VLARVETPRRVRLAFWAGEEYGLFGSRVYVDRLPEQARESITAYLNADMLGSRNGVRRVYAGSEGPPGSAAVEQALTRGFAVQGVPSGLEDALGGRSDHDPFADAGIPIGGLYSGANEIVGAEEAARDGAKAGAPADRCYHQACDRFEGVNLRLLQEMTLALVHAVVKLSVLQVPAV
ncbi:MAG: M28 family peptidase, partial [Actinobacteria bacterium]|nr:M28 family peptidase [Actinomycetota bacterium]